MEAKGITTDKGDLNRWIKAAKEELSRPQAPDLASLLIAYYNARNAGAWSQKARIIILNTD